MAQYYTDFSEYSTGPIGDSGDEWSRQQEDTSTDMWEITSNSEFEGGQALTYDDPDDDFDNDMVVWNEPEEVEDLEIVARIRGSNIAQVNHGLRITGTASTDLSGVFCRYSGIDEQWLIRTWFNGSPDTQGAHSYTYTDGDWIWVRLQGIGDEFKFRVWEDGNSEPSVWHIEETYSSLDGPGSVGVYGNWDGNVDTDIFGVGTEGDTAPTSSGGQTFSQSLAEVVGANDELAATTLGAQTFSQTLGEVVSTEYVELGPNQFYTDFSDYPTGAFPNGADWSVEYDPGGTWEILETERSLLEEFPPRGGTVLNISATASFNALSWDGMDGSSVETLAVISYQENSSVGYMRSYLRASGDANNKNGYFANVGALGDLGVSKYTDDTLTELDSSETGLQIPCFIRFRANGTDLKAKAWSRGDTEPSNWQIEITDSDHSQGWTGVLQFGSDSVLDWDQFSVGLNGEPAPKSVLRTPEEVVWGAKE